MGHTLSQAAATFEVWAKEEFAFATEYDDCNSPNLAKQSREAGKAYRRCSEHLAASPAPTPSPESTLEAAQVAPMDGGGVVLPVEPTDAMLKAGMRAADDKTWAWRGLGARPDGSGVDGQLFFVREAYRAMVREALATTTASAGEGDLRGKFADWLAGELLDEDTGPEHFRYADALLAIADAHRAALARPAAPAVDVPAERIAQVLYDHDARNLGPLWTWAQANSKERDEYLARANAILTTRPTDPGGAREIVRHVKRGTEYEVLVRGAQIQTDTPLTDYAKVDVYRGADGATWVRPVAEMHDGRFVPAASTASSDAEGAE